MSNIHSCSPLHINPADEGNVYLGSTSGVTFSLANEYAGSARLGIGVGSDTLNYKLWVKETTTHVQAKLESTNSYARWIIDSASGKDSVLQFNESNSRRWCIGVDGVDENLIFTRSDIVAGPAGYSGNTALAINSSDFVGIGTGDPQTLLHIVAKDNTDAIIRLESDWIQGPSESDNPRIEFVQDGGVQESAIGHNVSGDALDPNVFEIANSVTTSGGILFSTSNVNGFDNAIGRMFITSGGDVGIGTQAPIEKLHISGTSSTQIRVDTTSGNAGLILNGEDNALIDYKEDAAHMWRVGNHNPNDYFKWATGTTFNTDTVMRLTRGGDLLIEGNLDVNGATADFAGRILSGGTDLVDIFCQQPCGGGGTFTGNTSGTCISELWVTTISGCSPVTIGPDVIISNSLTVSTNITTNDIKNTDAGTLVSYNDGISLTTLGDGGYITIEGDTTISGDLYLGNDMIGDSTEVDAISLEGGGSGNVSIHNNLTIENNLNIGVVGSGTSLYNLGIDSTGTVVTGTTGGVTIDPYNDIGNVSTFNWDVSNSTNYEVTLTGDTEFTMTNMQNGDYGTLIVHQDATGSRTLTFNFGSNYVVNGGGGQATLTTDAGATDILSFTYNGTAFYWTVGNDYT